MKTRSPGQQPQTGLPPPPAPTARDANPWPMSSPAAEQHPPRHPGAPERPRPRLPQAPRADRHARRVPWIAFVIVFAIGAAAVQGAIRAIWAGDVQLAIAALAFIAIVAFAVLRRATRKR